MDLLKILRMKTLPKNQFEFFEILLEVSLCAFFGLDDVRIKFSLQLLAWRTGYYCPTSEIGFHELTWGCFRLNQ